MCIYKNKNVKGKCSIKMLCVYFMNLVLDNTIEFTKQGGRNEIGMVVIRGNSVVMIEAKDRI